MNEIALLDRNGWVVSLFLEPVRCMRADKGRRFVEAYPDTSDDMRAAMVRLFAEMDRVDGVRP